MGKAHEKRTFPKSKKGGGNTKNKGGLKMRMRTSFDRRFFPEKRPGGKKAPTYSKESVWC